MASLRTFDMFCGGGGSSSGAALAGAEIVGAVDLWDVAAQTHHLNFPSSTVYTNRVEEVTSKSLRKDIGKVDLLLASPECTSHSVAKGNKPRCEKSRETAFEVIRYAEVLNPRWVVVENVMQMQRWHRFEEWKSELEGLGYQTDVAVLNAKFFRTPQTRRRMILVADREAKPKLASGGRETTKTVASILGRGESKAKPWKFSPLKEKTESTLERAERAFSVVGKRTPFIMVYYGSDGAGGFQTIERPLRTVTTLDRFALVKPTSKGHVMRMLQPPELAAAMGFSSKFKWPKITRREKIKLIGNAVCPQMMRDVVTALTSKK